MITQLGIAVAALSFLGSMQGAAAYERWVEVVNGGDAAIWSVRISHIDDPQKGRRDLLGSYVIEPGSSMVVEPDNPQGYCRFDIFVLYENNVEVPVWDVNLCVEEAIFVNDMGYIQVGY